MRSIEPLERKELKILPPKKLSTRLSLLLARTKVGNNSYKLKSEFRQILYLYKILHQHKKITKNNNFFTTI